jgi:hypothetical protein
MQTVFKLTSFCIVATGAALFTKRVREEYTMADVKISQLHEGATAEVVVTDTGTDTGTDEAEVTVATGEADTSDLKEDAFVQTDCGSSGFVQVKDPKSGSLIQVKCGDGGDSFVQVADTPLATAIDHDLATDSLGTSMVEANEYTKFKFKLLNHFCCNTGLKVRMLQILRPHC